MISLCFSLALGCTLPAGVPPRVETPHDRFATINSELWAHTAQGIKSKVPVQGQDFYPLMSPDGNWLAVEIQQLSNLRTLRVFRRTPNGYEETPVNASSYLWQIARDTDAVDTDNIRHPAIRVNNWVRDSSALNVELRGVHADGEQYQRTIALMITELLQ